ncbi:MAG: hypothetical protein V1706_16805 [Pseudomonadota bacterium]
MHKRKKKKQDFKIESAIEKSQTVTCPPLRCLNSMSNGESSELVFLRPLSSNVLLGRVWIESDSDDVYKYNGVRMFFIKDSGKIVAAVYDMEPQQQDLHVFVQPENQGKGYLVIALTKVILPYLFSTGRNEQRITFQNETARHHAALVGFRFLPDSSAVITPADFPSMPDLSPGTFPAEEIQIKRIKKRIRMAADLLRMARDDFQTAFGENDDKEIWKDLDYYSDEIGNIEGHVSDLWRHHKNSN